VLVDAVDGELELIVKTLGEHLLHVENIAGATVLPNGEIVPLVQSAQLVERARRKGDPRALFAAPDAGKSSMKRILVVDDSITTRTLEKSILEASGYHVETATDGVDALGKLSASQFDLVLSDVQMPRMGGIELVRRVKANPAFRALPLVLVSSLNDVEDRRHGLEAGAAAYLGKSEFRQDLLLEMLEKLL
jgi:two-component system chemotaxis sensor kinase CheA